MATTQTNGAGKKRNRTAPLAPADETPEARFLRVGARRAKDITEMTAQIGKMAGSASYKYSATNVAFMFKSIRKAVDEAEAKFATTGEQAAKAQDDFWSGMAAETEGKPETN